MRAIERLTGQHREEVTWQTTAAPYLWPTEALVLRLLAETGETYGQNLVNASGGRLKRGTVYVYLARMEERGLVSSHLEEKHPEAIGLPRRIYKITRQGREATKTA